MEHILSTRVFNRKTGRFKWSVAEEPLYFVYADAKKPSDARLPDGDIWANNLIKQGNGKEVLLYIHGFNNTHNAVRARLKKMQAHLRGAGFRGAVAAFDWPSETKLDLKELITRKGYDKVVGRAQTAAPFLIDACFHRLWNAKPNLKIHVVAHSLGGGLLLKALAMVGKGQAPLVLTNKLDQIAFVAADVDQNPMMNGASYANTLEDRTIGVTNYYSGVDRVLDVSGKPLLDKYSRRIGQHGLQPSPPAKFSDVSGEERYLKLLPKGYSPETIGSHNWYFDDDERFYPDLVEALKGKYANFAQTRRPRPNGDMELLP